MKMKRNKQKKSVEPFKSFSFSVCTTNQAIKIKNIERERERDEEI